MVIVDDALYDILQIQLQSIQACFHQCRHIARIVLATRQSFEGGRKEDLTGRRIGGTQARIVGVFVETEDELGIWIDCERRWLVIQRRNIVEIGFKGRRIEDLLPMGRWSHSEGEDRSLERYRVRQGDVYPSCAHLGCI